MWDPITVSHLFSNRLYVLSPKEEGNKATLYDSGKECKGAGVRSYSKPVGAFLSLFKIAIKLKVNNELFYLNNKSVCKLVIRFGKMENIDTSNKKTMIAALHQLYQQNKKTGYDKNRIKKMQTVISEYRKTGGSDLHSIFDKLENAT